MATTPKTEEKADGLHTMEDLVEGLETEDLLGGYEIAPVETVDVAVQEWRMVSRQWAGIVESAKVKRILAAQADGEEKKRILDEAKQIEDDQLKPVRKHLNVITQRIRDTLAENEAIRNRVQNWLVMPVNLRPLLKNALAVKGVDVTEVLVQVKKIEDQQHEQLRAKVS